ncbi:4-hydroxybenzoate polyprenyltransferase [Stackebrandtia albiflava]|uniref:4-hydroxybenzoate polyprenyltransferase n=1 Tax=Stackebrandtia albiflava TaxID=406432 RepID=A0A562V2Y4_9ACTN|nr:menaquinone biosynthesis prenyltransferase MqnP [Stackebrandtia albiflava]TWJ12167.1 4-hydroxybenzoate polyprenyltransferase [Stackebrandtia albiflava]
MSGVLGRTRAFLRLVAIEHSVFALPFAYLATLAAMYDQAVNRRDEAYLESKLGPDFTCPGGADSCGVSFVTVGDTGGIPPVTGWIQWDVLLLVTVAMVAGRTFAMAANRIIDRHIDARNPRTANRELVTGAVSLRTAYIGSGVSLVVFFAAAAALNPLCLLLSPLAVIPLVVYPYGKRFTDFPHAILALAQLVAPVGGWLAVTGTFDGFLPSLVLGLAVGLWIGGFDLIYACQDVAADRTNGVRSFPARFGIKAALWTSSAVHVVTFGLFAWFGVLMEFPLLYWIGLLVTAAVFVYEHRIVRPDDLSRVNRAFFTANGVIGIVLFCFALGDLLFLMD